MTGPLLRLVRNSANRKSFQAEVNCQIIVTTKPGTEIGRTMERRSAACPAPSTLAASMISLGTAVA